MNSTLARDILNLRASDLRPLFRAHGLHGTEAIQAAREALQKYAVSSAGKTHSTWQEAWNTLTRATPGSHGVLETHPAKCLRCGGRRVDFTFASLSKVLARGLPQGTCGECFGTGRGQRIRLIAYHAPVPAASR